MTNRESGSAQDGTEAPDEQVCRIIAEVLECDPSAVTMDLAQQDIQSWDSLRHLMLVSALEEALGVRFSMEDVGAMTSVEEIVRRVRASR